MTLERDLREMLDRRAADIAGPTRPTGQHPGRSLGLRGAVALTAAAAVLAVGLGWSLLDRESATVRVGDTPEPAPVTSTLPDEQAPPVEADEPTDDSATTSTMLESDPAGDAWRAALPPHFDPFTAPQVEAYQGPIPHIDAAARYLQAELPDLADRIDMGQVTTTDDGLTLVRWTLSDEGGNDEFIPAGTIVVRDHAEVTLVIAALTDGVDASGLVRTPDQVEGEIIHDAADLLAVDVLAWGGIPAGESPFLTDTDGSDRPFGTAGSTNDEQLVIDVPLGEARYADTTVKIRHVGGTILSITEFGFFSPGFSLPCPSDQRPTFVPGIGIWFDERIDGPLPESSWPEIENQERWYVSGEYGTVEVLWPAMPILLPFPSTSPDAGLSTQRLNPSPGRYEVVVGQSNDPCEHIQFSLRGDDDATSWWADALSGQWGFGLGLSLAELDPAELGSAPADLGIPVVVETRETVELPRVPAAGSCDGLPDAPPFAGDGAGAVEAGPVEALGSFLATRPLDGVLPRSGYVALERAGLPIGFVVEGDRSVVVVVELEEVATGWRVVRWEAAAC